MSVLSASVVQPKALLSAAEAVEPLVVLSTRKSPGTALKKSALAPRVGPRGTSAMLVVAGVVVPKSLSHHWPVASGSCAVSFCCAPPAAPPIVGKASASTQKAGASAVGRVARAATTEAAAEAEATQGAAAAAEAPSSGATVTE